MNCPEATANRRGRRCYACGGGTRPSGILDQSSCSWFGLRRDRRGILCWVICSFCGQEGILISDSILCRRRFTLGWSSICIQAEILLDRYKAGARFVDRSGRWLSKDHQLSELLAWHTFFLCTCCAASTRTEEHRGRHGFMLRRFDADWRGGTWTPAQQAAKACKVSLLVM